MSGQFEKLIEAIENLSLPDSSTLEALTESTEKLADVIEKLCWRLEELMELKGYWRYERKAN